LATAYETRDDALLQALERSELWFKKPSTEQWFPIEEVTHAHAALSVKEARRLFGAGLETPEFVAEFLRLFDVYESVGYDDQGSVFFTGYFSPVFKGSRTRTERYRHPIYKRPADLVTDEQTGEPRGRKLEDGSIAPYPTREEIESSGLLRGLELAWLEDSLSAYVIHVNGSARIELDDGSVLFVSYHGKTDRPYASLGEMLVYAKLLPPEERSLAGIRRVYRENPAAVERLMKRNESFVFFRETGADAWPHGSLGFPVTPMTTLATDKRIFPRAGLVLVEATAGPPGDIRRFMLDQDTGGAIRAPGRADIYKGVGAEAEALAGERKSQGRLYYFFLKPEHLPPAESPSP
jgi:membrane-bound lytic murein transglycosylase A